jgi:hypothetical protein
MGADMLIASLVLPKRVLPDFAAAHRRIESLGVADIEDSEEFCDLPDPRSAEGMRALREDLHRCLTELEEALVGREFTWTEVRGAQVYLTGGPSWGDSPTAAIRLVDRLRAVRGVLAAAGFEGEPE